MAGKKIIIITGLLIAISIPLTLSLIKQQTSTNSRASAPDKLEAEGGTLNSNAQAVTDSTASGGSFVKLNTASAPTPTPSTGAYGPRSTPSTPTGSNVYTVSSSIDGTGNTDVSSALQSFVNSVQNAIQPLQISLFFLPEKLIKLIKGSNFAPEVI